MNALKQAQQAYGASRSSLRTPRSVEYEAFARVSHNIRSAQQNGKSGFNALVQALHDNRKLWTILAADVAEETNALPPELKARIFYLAEFTNVQTRKVLKGEASADVLIDVNMAIMRGLSGGG